MEHRTENEPDFLTIAQVAKLLQVSAEHVAKHFGGRGDVVDLSFGGTSRRRYRTLRIPREALRRFLAEKRVSKN